MPLFLAIFALPMVALGDIQEGTGRANSWPIAALGPTYIVRPLLILLFMELAVNRSAIRPPPRPPWSQRLPPSMSPPSASSC